MAVKYICPIPALLLAHPSTDSVGKKYRLLWHTQRSRQVLFTNSLLYVCLPKAAIECQGFGWVGMCSSGLQRLRDFWSSAAIGQIFKPCPDESRYSFTCTDSFITFPLLLNSVGYNFLQGSPDATSPSETQTQRSDEQTGVKNILILLKEKKNISSAVLG